LYQNTIDNSPIPITIHYCPHSCHQAPESSPLSLPCAFHEALSQSSDHALSSRVQKRDQDEADIACAENEVDEGKGEDENEDEEDRVEGEVTGGNLRNRQPWN